MSDEDIRMVQEHLVFLDFEAERDQAVQLLADAANKLTKLGSAATPGQWWTHDTHLGVGGHTASVLTGESGTSKVELLAWLPTFSNEPWDQSRNVWNNAQWIAVMGPTIAPFLAAWLSQAAQIAAAAPNRGEFRVSVDRKALGLAEYVMRTGGAA
ncbi:hypothetical protein [Kutzneria albida]|uniref:Uncharacterized protein n=1 Tax=Kutzneria albida DSM 43870 TaxID=1449976 RepID=W5WAS0_9PSEU|nr:hypothetical protein [Kutzneria albida]AHH98218.1 hypothetical protein KALB_4856 [Kutzneria albida DSM 43870]